MVVANCRRKYHRRRKTRLSPNLRDGGSAEMGFARNPSWHFHLGEVGVGVFAVVNLGTTGRRTGLPVASGHTTPAPDRGGVSCESVHVWTSFPAVLHPAEFRV